MSEVNAIAANGAEAGYGYRWIVCNGCEGEVGIPSDYSENSVECPNCQAKVLVAGKVLFRAPPKVKTRPNSSSAVLSDEESVPSGSGRVVVTPRPLLSPLIGPSVDLQRQADKVLIMGVLSILFGWTVLLPMFTIAEYVDASNAAKKENVPTPGKANTGLVLALLFGSVQILTLIARLAK